MSLDKAISHGKEHRKPYTGAKSFARSCRNHGGCSWCLDDRICKYNRKKLAMDQRLKEYEDDYRNQNNCPGEPVE